MEGAEQCPRAPAASPAVPLERGAAAVYKGSMGKPGSEAVGVLCLAATILLFSSFEVTSKLLSPPLAPLQITLSRFAIGGLALLPFALGRMARRGWRLTGRAAAGAALLGFVNIVVSMGLVQLGISYSSASASAALFSANPLLVVFFARPLLGERITAAKIGGAVLGLSGAAIILGGGFSAGTRDGLGLLLVAGAAAAFALYTVLGKRIIAASGLDSLAVTAFSFVAGSAMLVPIMLAAGVPLVPDAAPVLPQLLYMSLAVTGLAYVLYFEGLSRLEAGAGSMLYFAKPALAAIIAALVLGEKPGWPLFLGMLVIASGILLSLRGGRNRAGAGA